MARVVRAMRGQEACQGEPPWGLGIDPDFADELIAERDPDRLVIDVEREFKCRREAAVSMMEVATPMMKHGGDRTVKEQGDNITLIKKARGTDPEYLAARIKRDRPDIAADVAAGKYGSMRQAGIAALLECLGRTLQVKSLTF